MKIEIKGYRIKQDKDKKVVIKKPNGVRLRTYYTDQKYSEKELKEMLEKAIFFCERQ